MAFFLLASLLGLSWNLTYTAEEWHCDSGRITVVLHEQSLPVELFDIRLTENGKIRACEILADAETVTFEIDDHVAQTHPLPVWLFADGQLVQRQLVEEGLASVTIANPDYTYASQLRSAQPVSGRMTGFEGIPEYSRRRGELGLARLCFLISGGLLTWILTGVLRRRRQS